MNKRNLPGIIVLAFVLSSSIETRAIDGSLGVVAYTSQSVPDESATLANLDVTAGKTINDDARVAFSAYLSDSGTGIYSWQNGILSERLRSGSEAPGSGTFMNVAAGDLMQNALGEVLFYALLDGTPGGDDDNAGVYWLDQADAVTEIVRKGDALPIVGGAAWNGFTTDRAVINDSGHALLGLAFDDTQAADRGLFYWDGSTLTKIVRNGDPLPPDSTIGNPSFSDLGFGVNLRLNNSGEFAFMANNGIVYRGTTTTLSEVDAPLVDPEMVDLNNNGTLAFTTVFGVFTQETNGAPVETAVARNDLAPNGVDEYTSFQEMKLTDSGFIAFKAGLNIGSTFRVALFRFDGTNVVEVFRAINPSEIFDLEPEDPSTFNEFTINEQGWVAYEASLRNGNSAMFIFDGSTTTRIIQGPIQTGSGRPRLFNNANFNSSGQLLFDATFHPVPNVAGLNFSILLFTPDPPAGPDMMFSRVGEQFHILWPAEQVGFSVESASSLQPPVVWEPVVGDPEQVDGNLRVVAPIGDENGFYRLRQ